MTFGLLKQHLALAQQYHVYTSLFAPVCKHYKATFFTECRTFSYLFLLSLPLFYIISIRAKKGLATFRK